MFLRDWKLCSRMALLLLLMVLVVSRALGPTFSSNMDFHDFVLVNEAQPNYRVALRAFLRALEVVRSTDVGIQSLDPKYGIDGTNEAHGFGRAAIGKAGQGSWSATLTSGLNCRNCCRYWVIGYLCFMSTPTLIWLVMIMPMSLLIEVGIVVHFIIIWLMVTVLPSDPSTTHHGAHLAVVRMARAKVVVETPP